MRSISTTESPPWRVLLLLGAVAIGLALLGLGNLPLRDFDEATVARVAMEFSQGLGEAPFLPTLWGDPYLNKAPGLHLLIAAAIRLSPSGSALPSDFTIRLVPAVLSALVVPLGGLLQWKLRPGDRTSAVATSAILLTLLPIARHGRLAMLDGSQLTAMAVLWLSLVELGDRPRTGGWALLAGLMASAMLLLKAPLLLPALAASGLAILWGREWRRWSVLQVIVPGVAGLLPGCAWHLWHAQIRGSQALWMWNGDGAGRVLFAAGEGSDLGWRVPLIELMEGGWPWLVLVPFAVIWAWRCRSTPWGRWTLATLLMLSAAILPLKTQLPWYSHPLWLPMALLCGPLLAWLVEQPLPTDAQANPPARLWLQRLSRVWWAAGLLLLLLWSLSFSSVAAFLAPYRWLAAALGLGWSLGGWWLQGRQVETRRRGVISLVCGNVVALALLFLSPLWIWELNESWPVAPAAALARQSTGSPVLLQGFDERPSLNWYASQRIRRYDKGADGLVLSQKQGLNCPIAAKLERWTLLECR